MIDATYQVPPHLIQRKILCNQHIEPYPDQPQSMLKLFFWFFLHLFFLFFVLSSPKQQRLEKITKLNAFLIYFKDISYYQKTFDTNEYQTIKNKRLAYQNKELTDFSFVDQSIPIKQTSMYVLFDNNPRTASFLRCSISCFFDLFCLKYTCVLCFFVLISFLFPHFFVCFLFQFFHILLL